MVTTRSGDHSQEISFRLWHHPYPASVHSHLLVKTKEIGLVMTESGLRRCGPVCGVQECELQGLVQRTEFRGVRKVCAEHGEWYGDRRLVRRYGIEEWVRGSQRALASTYRLY